MHIQAGLLYPPVWHETLAASLPLMLECDIPVPRLLDFRIEVWCELITQCSILPVSSLSVKEDVVQNFWNPLPVCCRARPAGPQSDCLAGATSQATRKPQEEKGVMNMLLRHGDLNSARRDKVLPGELATDLMPEFYATPQPA